jgi:hypothetical protein
MTADIKYIVKYHPLPVKKVANILFGFAGLIIILLSLIWSLFEGLTPDMRVLAIFYIIPDVFWDMHYFSIICIAIGFGLRLFRWRAGKIELTEEKVIIEGSYHVSIWLKNMWEVDVRDLMYHRWCIRLDSNVDAVQIKFKTELDFENYSEKLVQLVEHVENIRLKTST